MEYGGFMPDGKKYYFTGNFLVATMQFTEFDQ